MNEQQLSQENLYILDIIANMEPLLKSDIPGFVLARDYHLTETQSEETLDRLSQLRLITVKKLEYGSYVYLDSNAKDKRDGILSDLWKRNKVETELLQEKAKADIKGVLKFLELESIYDNRSRIAFSDNSLDRHCQDFCEELLGIGMVFKHAWSSKKHYYVSYYPRRIPVDVEAFFKDFILSRLNPEGLRLETEWRILLTLIFSESAPKIGDIELNLPELTLDEVNETLAKLQQSGILTREGEGLRVPEAAKKILEKYFFDSRYQQFRSSLTRDLTSRVSENTSNLRLLGVIQGIIASASIENPLSPFCAIKRSLIKDANERDLREAVKLGIVMLTESDIIVVREVLLDLQNVLKSSLEERQVRQGEARVRPYDTLRELETELRNCISTKLRSLSPNWWIERVPDDVRESAENRKKSDQKPWPWYEQRDLHPIFYVNFAEYAKIIQRRGNWRNIFEVIFHDKEMISSKLRELEPIRNAVAHNRELKASEEDRLKLLASDIRSCFRS